MSEKGEFGGRRIELAIKLEVPKKVVDYEWVDTKPTIANCPYCRKPVHLIIETDLSYYGRCGSCQRIFYIRSKSKLVPIYG
jgi:hypothetical protein